MARKDTVLLLLCILLLTLAVAQTAPECINGEIRLVDDPNSQPGTHSGSVDYCSNDTWKRMCIDGNDHGTWTPTEAAVACRQLGYQTSCSTVTAHFETGCATCKEGFFRIVMNCKGTENTIGECGRLEDLKSCPSMYNGWLECVEACTDGEIRLVGPGSSNIQGRVEVCIDGHWGTICNESKEDTGVELASAVCHELGLGPQMTRSFGPGFVPISRCTVTGAGNLNCSVITDASCDHSMDLGVVCSTYEQLYNELLAQQSTTDPCCTSDEGCASTPVLGGVVGVLVTVLVVLVIGWSLSCVALVKRNSHSQKQTQRADTKEEEEHTYSVLERCEKISEERSKSTKTTAEVLEHY